MKRETPTEAIELTFSEIIQGALVGIMRQTSNLKNGRKDRYGARTENGWQLHIEGALGEMAAAKLADKFWSGSLGNFHAADVSTLQVRTCSKDWHSLIVHPRDADDDWFVLLSGHNGKYEAAGAIRGHDAKQKRYWKDPGTGRPAYFIPREALIPVSNVLQKAKAPVSSEAPEALDSKQRGDTL